MSFNLYGLLDMKGKLPSSWLHLWVVVVLLLCHSHSVRLTNAALSSSRASSRYASTRHPIKINPGPPAATRTPADADSHTFTMPDPPITSPPDTPHNQADDLRAAKKPQQQQQQQPQQQQPQQQQQQQQPLQLPTAAPQPSLPVAQPADFSLPPPLLAQQGSVMGVAGADGLVVGEMYEEALWRRWDGACMHARLDDYLYSLCPFHNVTQRGLRLTSLNAVLGSAEQHTQHSRTTIQSSVVRARTASPSTQRRTHLSTRFCRHLCSACGRAGGSLRVVSWR